MSPFTSSIYDTAVQQGNNETFKERRNLLSGVMFLQQIVVRLEEINFTVGLIMCSAED